jgi:hypothetical protein
MEVLKVFKEWTLEVDRVPVLGVWLPTGKEVANVKVVAPVEKLLEALEWRCVGEGLCVIDMVRCVKNWR